MYICKMPGQFGHEPRIDVQGFAANLVGSEHGTLFHCVDVYETEEEWLSQSGKPEPCGWTYVTDCEGYAALIERCFDAMAYDTRGYLEETVNG